MSSYHSSPNLPVSPYVSNIDPQVYASVGMAKQQQYNTNIAKIQGYIDTVAGLEVVKDSHKQYLNDTISNLQTDIQKLAGEDFSRQNVVNQASGLASRIAKDPTIQNAVISTQNYKKGLQQMQDAQSKGTLDIKNKDYFETQAQSWLNDGSLETSFNGQYIPYTDITSEFLKVYKEIKPDSRLTQQDIQVGPNGMFIQKETMEEGIDAQTVQDIWATVSQKGNVRQQMIINAAYDYKGHDKNTLLPVIKKQYDNLVTETTDKIAILQSRISNDSTANVEVLTKQIDALKAVNANYLSEYENVSKLSGEALKVALYETNLTSSLVNSFSWSKKSEKIQDSPFEKAREWQLDYELKTQQFRENAEEKARKRTATGGIDTQVTQKAISEDAGKLGESTFKAAISSTREVLNQETRKHINAIALSEMGKQPWKLSPDGTYIPNVGPNGYPDANSAQIASDSIYAKAKELNEGGKAKAPITAMFNEISPLQRSLRAMEIKDEEIKTKYNLYTGNLYDKRMESVVGPPEFLIGRELVDSKSLNPKYTDVMGRAVDSDFANLYAYENLSGEDKDTAKKLLVDKFGEQGFKAFSDYANGFESKKNSQIGKAYYSQVKANLEKTPFIANFKNAQQDYKDAQSAYVEYQEDFVTGKPEEQKDLGQRYKSVVSEIAPDAQDNKGPYKEFIEAIESDDKGTNIYGYYYNRLENKPYLTIKKEGEETISVPVSSSAASLIPGVKLTDEFWKTYGADLSVTSNTTTNVDGSGGNAYVVPSTPQNKYKVQYHLNGAGDGNFMLSLTIFDKAGNKRAANLPYSLSPTGDYMSPAQIIAAVNALKEDRLIEGILAENKPE